MKPANNDQDMGLVIVSNRVAVPAEAPSRIMIIPWGEVETTQGTFTMDRAAADRIVEALKAHGVDIPVDREHATVGGKFTPPDGSAPAMAWIKSLEIVEGDGVYANVEWTPKGKEHVESKEYRYLSPTIVHRKSDHAVMRLHSVALTNKPAIVGMKPITNKEDVMTFNEDLLERSRWFLNLPTTATETEIMEHFEKLLVQLRELAGVSANTDQQGTLAALKEKLKGPAPSTLRPELCKTLALKEDVADEAIVKACSDAIAKAQNPDPAKYTPNEAVAALTEKVKAMEDERLGEKAEAFLKQGEDAGKIVASNREMWKRSYMDDADRAKKELDVALVIAPPNGRRAAPATSQTSAKAGDVILANSERFDQSRMGKYEEAKKYQKENKCTFDEACTIVGA